jgi:hypothetical protein
MFETASGQAEDRELHDDASARCPPLYRMMGEEAFVECLAACSKCERACNACADACLADSELWRFTRCIKDSLYCAELCAVSARLLERAALESNVEALLIQLDLCARACDTCAAECRDCVDAHAHFEATREVCVQCAEQCRKMLQHFSSSGTQPYGDAAPVSRRSGSGVRSGEARV